MGPPANTVAAFEDRYRANLHDVWDTAYFCVCPADINVSFKEEGKGTFFLGMGQGGGEFEWRQAGEFRIEVRRSEEEEWSPIEYGFAVKKGIVHMHLWPQEDALDWVNEFTWDWLPLSGTSPPP